MNKITVKRLDLNERQEALVLYDKVLRAIRKGSEARVKRDRNGDLNVYEVNMKKTE